MSIFTKVKVPKIKRSTFDMSHDVKMSTDMGRLTPCLCMDILPGDSAQIQSEFMMRVAPLLAPVMHRVNVYMHSFFVPNRLIWNDWEKFISGPKDAKDDVDPIKPIFRVDLRDNAIESWQKDLFKPGSLLDYLGFPTFTGDEQFWIEHDGNYYYDIDMMPVFAYWLIWKEYYRDQNLTGVDGAPLDVLDEVLENGKLPSGIVLNRSGSDLEKAYWKLLKLRNRSWEKDYFTSALPWPQKGPDVSLPLTGDADVVLDTDSMVHAPILKMPKEASGRLTDQLYPLNQKPATVISDRSSYLLTTTSNSVQNATLIDPNGSLKADMSTVSATTINELRRASALQRWLERNALGGNRYIETIFNHFGVRSSDARLQRPEYLGGGKSPIVISEVTQTSSSQESPSGDLEVLGTPAGRGVSAGVSRKFKYYAEEHGWIISILSVIPRSAYQQGLPRMFNRLTRFDYAWPEFSHIGEQAVLNQELYFLPGKGTYDSPGENQGEFGYQSRYAEYKYMPGAVHGDMRTSLSFWHLGRQFSNLPGLNSDFVTVQPDEVSRIYAVENDAGKPIDHLWIQLYHNIKMKRKLPYYGTPY